MSLVQILPLPNGKLLTDTNTQLTDLSCNTDLMTTCQNGDYIATASSYSNGQVNSLTNTKAFNAFNGSTTTFWQSDFMNNPDYDSNKFLNKAYSQNPYTEENPSSYQGGGIVNNTYGTIVTSGKNNTTINGEWLQIQLPYSIHLYKYDILTPFIGEKNTFPKKFLVVGSNDGKTWNYIDQRNVQNISGSATPVTYNVNSSTKYSYFRLIISELEEGNGYVAINQWNLTGTFFLTVNKEAFTQMSKSITTAPSNPNYFDINNKTITNAAYSIYAKQELTVLPTITSTMEGFNTYGYDMPNDNNPDKISQNQNEPLKQISSDYSNLQNQVSSKYYEIGKNIDKITNSSNTGIRDILLSDDKYDFSGNLLNFLNKKPTLAEARQKDSKIMLVEQNSVYIFGSITAVSLLILAILIARE